MTVDPRRVALVAAAALALLAVVVVLAWTIGDSGSPERGASAGTVSSAASAPSTAAPPPAPIAGDGSIEDVTPLDDEGLVAARVAAADFAVGFSGYRFDDEPGAALARVRPLVTDLLAESLAQNSGALAEAERRRAREEVATATLDAAVSAGHGEDAAQFNVIVTLSVTSTDGTTDRSLLYRVGVVRARGGWLVDSVALV